MRLKQFQCFISVLFHRRCLRSILGISWRDHITNDEVMARTGQAALHDTVATRRRRFVGHILRLPTTRPASLVIIWRPEGGRRRAGRPKRTWQDTLKEDLDTLGLDANGDNSSPNVLIRTEGTKSKQVSYFTVCLTGLTLKPITAQLLIT